MSVFWLLECDYDLELGVGQNLGKFSWYYFVNKNTCFVCQKKKGTIYFLITLFFYEK